jgi:hypothetical protein
VKAALPIALFAALAAYVGAHLALVGGLVAAGRWGRAALALVVPPLAPWWGWEQGMRRRVVAWAAALAVYALLVALA